MFNFIKSKFNLPQSEESHLENEKELERVRKAFFTGCIYGFIAYVVLIIYSIIIPHTETTSSIESFRPAVYFLSAVVIAPIVEEYLCRFIIYKKMGDFIDKYFHAVVEKNVIDIFFINHGYKVMMLVSGLVFITIHRMGVTYWPFYLFVSVLFCSGYSKTGSMITPIVSHSFFNLVNFWINMMLLGSMGG